MCVLDIGIVCVIYVFVMFSVCDVVSLMCCQQVGCLVVLCELLFGLVLVGMVIDCDLVIEVIVVVCDFDCIMLGEVMFVLLVVCCVDVMLVEVVGILCGSGVCWLLLVDGDGCLVGLVSVDDVLVVFNELLG